MVRRINCPGYVRPVHVEAANSSVASGGIKSRPESNARHPNMSVRETDDQDTFELLAEDGFPESVDTSSHPVTRVDAAHLIRIWQKLALIGLRQAPRIAFKAKGRILFLELAEIVAVQAEGNYVSLQHRPKPYLLHESLSSMAEKLKPYGFIRIHRSVVVNTSAVVEIQPLPTGEYRLRVKGGKEYLVTRRYKDRLRDLAQLWVGSEFFCS
jgi:DNA-binding LytR/AlgR family response regulator